MALRANATLTFTAYEVTDEGIMLTFVCADPGAGEPNEYRVLVTDAELGAVTTALMLRNLVVSKLQRRLRAAGIAAKLDPFLGQSITV